MRAFEFIMENITTKKGKISHEHEKVFTNTKSFPAQNMNHGSQSLNAWMHMAVAGAGAGNTPDGHMVEKSWHGGDPIATPYCPEELEMIQRALAHVGDNDTYDWGGTKSEEPEYVNKNSVVAKSPSW